jgi:hypothetical protein
MMLLVHLARLIDGQRHNMCTDHMNTQHFLFHTKLDDRAIPSHQASSSLSRYRGSF